ncbi:TIGR01777 family oxidoreductase [Actinophytocola sp. NPDC049390]|uniref:TIGR01777 family oxidoreductase n=1 Tax=Actinophytocola sp. NPDC049390 TaxID=3363894 RepID=UPI0037BC9123
MKVVVAGASGLIGTALVTELREAGHDVLRLVRRTAKRADERSWDPPAGRIDDDALAGADAVVNLCGAPIAGGRWSHARRQLLVNSRVEPTEVLAAAVAERGVPVLVNASAAGYYGDKGDQVVEESAPRGSGFLADLCGRWEAATERAADAGARVVRLRTGHVLARRGGLVGMLKPLFKLALGGKLGNGRQYMPWIHVADQTAAIRYLVEHDSVSGAVNVCSPNPVTNTEFTAAFGRATRRPAPWFVPSPAIRLAAGDSDGEILYSQRMVPAVLAHNGFTHRHVDLDETLSSLLQ